MTAPIIARHTIRMATCVHEAGHTTAALKLGLAFVKVKVITDTSGVVEDRGVPEGWDLPSAITSQAGYAAEVRWLIMNAPDAARSELLDRAYTAAEFDFRMMYRHARRADVALSAVRTSATNLVRANWQPLMRTAAVLYGRRTMSASQVRRVARL